MRIADSRRLTGRNLQSANPCAVAEVRFEKGEDESLALNVWCKHVNQLCQELGLDVGEPFVRRYQGGACLGFDAPIDALYTATEINEYAIDEASNRSTEAHRDRIKQFRSALDNEANPRLLELQAEASKRDCPFLWDDDEVSIGFGQYAQIWATDNLPEREDIEWPISGRVPVAMITGTNGKTTTSRMLSRILKTAGFSVGSTSTDGVCINEEIVEAGDWTGTGAARMVLRRSDISAAVLETARGGLLRRGLAMTGCDVAILTNVAADHLGDYGIDDVAAMAQVKSLISSAVKPTGQRVINADDKHLMARRHDYDTPIVLFGLDFKHPELVSHRQAGRACWSVNQGMIVYSSGTQIHELMRTQDIPCTFGGAAKHNVSNALAAAAAASVLGVEFQTIRAALSGFGDQPSDNPGRCQLVEVHGVKILLDFGHNSHGLKAILDLGKSLIAKQPGARLCVSLGQAGDRLDSEILALGDTLSAMGTDRVILREMAGYERGRAPAEVATMIRQRLIELEYDSTNIHIVKGEINALDDALSWSKPGDLIMLLVHLEREAVSQWITDQNNGSTELR